MGEWATEGPFLAASPCPRVPLSPHRRIPLRQAVQIESQKHPRPDVRVGVDGVLPPIGGEGEGEGGEEGGEEGEIERLRD